MTRKTSAAGKEVTVLARITAVTIGKDIGGTRGCRTATGSVRLKAIRLGVTDLTKTTGNNDYRDTFRRVTKRGVGSASSMALLLLASGRN
jgi:hypothetical protein